MYFNMLYAIDIDTVADYVKITLYSVLILNCSEDNIHLNVLVLATFHCQYGIKNSWNLRKWHLVYEPDPPSMYGTCKNSFHDVFNFVVLSFGVVTFVEFSNRFGVSHWSYFTLLMDFNLKWSILGLTSFTITIIDHHSSKKLQIILQSSPVKYWKLGRKYLIQ